MDSASYRLLVGLRVPILKTMHQAIETCIIPNKKQKQQGTTYCLDYSSHIDFWDAKGDAVRNVMIQTLFLGHDRNKSWIIDTYGIFYIPFRCLTVFSLVER